MTFASWWPLERAHHDLRVVTRPARISPAQRLA